MKLRTLSLLGVAVAFTLQTSPQSKEPWETAFSSNTKAVLEAARRVNVAEDAGVVILLEQHQITIDEGRRITSKVRRVFRIVKQDEVEDWSSVEQPYEPWHETKPELRARVISANGKVSWLDPKTIADAPVREYDESIFSDRRVLRAPLPAVAAGAVVEYEIISRETAPVLDAGEARRIYVPGDAPVESFRITIEASRAVPLQTVAKLIPESAIQRQDSGSTTRIEVELSAKPEKEDFEMSVPADTAEHAYFSFSTGRLWQEIAARYAAVVDQQLRSAEVKPMLEGVSLQGSPQEVAARLVAKLHSEIRYTGVEFGEAALVPRTPAETQKRKYGDCKDKAALLVALLRAAGLEASVALLDSGWGTDVDPETPGIGVFNHAIVYVGGESPLWIDATADTTRVGELPLADQGRLALIAQGKTTGLVKTGKSSADDNWRVHRFEVRMSELGAGRIVESVETHGSQETQMRQIYSGDGKKMQESLEKYVKRDFLAKSLGPYQVTKKDDFSERFRMTVQMEKARRVFTTSDDAVVVLYPYLAFSELPYLLGNSGDGNEAQEKAKPRKHDFEFNEPHWLEFHYVIYPPALFKVKALPASEELKLGTATYIRTFRQNADGSIEAIFRFHSGKQRINGSEFDALREGLKRYNTGNAEILEFNYEPGELAAVGEVEKALKMARENAAKHPEESAAQLRMARLMEPAGATERAVALAKGVLEKEPESGQAWQALGWAYQHDSFGRRFRGDWNPGEAEKSYREAIKLEADEIIPRIDLAILLEHNAEGQRYGKGSRMTEAIELYRESLKHGPNGVVQNNLAVALLEAGRYAEAKAEAKKVPGANAQALGVVLTALSEGTARAIVEVQTSYMDARSRAVTLLNTAQTLIQMRQYERAVELMKAASRTASIPGVEQRIEIISKFKRYEDVLYAHDDPRYLVQQLFLAFFSQKLTMSQLRPLFTKREDLKSTEGEFEKMKRSIASSRGSLAMLGLTPDNVLDITISLLQMEKEGTEDTGYLVHTAAEAQSPLGSMYVIREDGEYRILGSNDGAEHVGELVLDLLASGNIKAAQWWLDKTVAGLKPKTPEGTGGSAARFLWSGVNEQTRGPEAIRVAAASLISTSTKSEKAIQILKEARAKASVQIEKAQLDLALCQSYDKAKQWIELLQVAQRLAAVQTFADDGFEYMVKARTGLQQWKELRADAEKKLKDRPDNMAALRAMANVLAQNGNREGAAEYFKRVADTPFSRPEDKLLEAWNAILARKTDDALLKKVSEQKSKGDEEADYWYTLGMLQALAGQPDEAERSLRTGLEHDEFSELESTPWVLQGKIRALYGEPEAAAAAYEKAKSSPHRSNIAEWSLSLTGKK